MASIRLIKATVNKYKSIQKPQTIEIDPAITTIVGMNESGKTSFLQVLAKTNYFNDDFKFDTTQDYPRNELVDFINSDEEVEIVKCDYEISNELLQKIETEIGKDVFTVKNFSYSYYYNNGNTVANINANQKKFLEFKIQNVVLSKETIDAINKLTSLQDVAAVPELEGDTGLAAFKIEIKKIVDAATWDNKLAFHIFTKWIKPSMPKFWYFDDYYHLEGKIDINALKNNVNDEKTKTAKALFELASIQPNEILSSSSYERFVALLEASSNKITSEIFKYWSTNNNLEIEFRIQDITNPKGGEPQKFLDIRVRSQRHKISLPLDRRSKGFNWFFSFIIWFSKIQADKSSDYILLLDEPGLSLHASAQADLLRFIEDLSKKYQIIYTTHSPFMVESDNLKRVRTCLETDEGTIISDSIQEKDPKTLFPLQAALGYDIAQNLFISTNNLLVEGPADLIYLTIISNLLEQEKRTGLKDSITIIPVGGLDKVSTFISLLRGSKLNVVCLLDTFTDPKGKQRVEDLIKYKIIKDKNIRFFNEFANNGSKVADIEDLFTKEEYLKLFNLAFKDEYSEIKLTDLDSGLETILKQINKVISKDRFNHYRTANKLNQLGVDISYFSKSTLDNFEKMFIEINKLF
jgi:predicted ATP-dependent endonuclease of OLD family